MLRADIVLDYCRTGGDGQCFSVTDAWCSNVVKVDGQFLPGVETFDVVMPTTLSSPP